MTLPRQFDALRAVVLALVAISSLGGCSGFLEPREPYPITPPEPSPLSTVPRELDKVSLPRYVIEPPDILMINAIKVVPRPPHRLEPFDGILVSVANTFADAPIRDAYFLDPEGKIDLGPTYGRVSVVGMTTDEAQDAIRRHLANILDDPQVTVSLAFSSGVQQIQGEHLVGPDGYVNLGTYGSVHVAGLTLDEATEQIERLLSNELLDPQVVVDVFAYNSKKYYIVTQGAGLGDNVAEAPITGNETVLDAISRIGGFSQLSSKNIWIARPAPNGVGCEQVLPVNWDEISRGASTATNYQLMPGDRVYIAEDALWRFDSLLAKYTRPMERLFGIVSLGTGTFHRITRFGLANF